MIVPEGMTEEEVMTQIKKVVDKIAHNYTFPGFVIADLKQEAFIICMEALDRYIPGRPLENFLSVHLSNRLKNFVRDNHHTDPTSDKGKIVQPAQLNNEDSLLDGSEKFKVDYTSLDVLAMKSCIDRHLPSSLRMDYLKVVNEAYLPKKRREQVMDEIKEILIEHGLHKEPVNEEG
jgi:DNA-directed RNA polymerase specialized sigma24 family protein